MVGRVRLSGGQRGAVTLSCVDFLDVILDGI